jgi:hypothetical protein
VPTSRTTWALVNALPSLEIKNAVPEKLSPSGFLAICGLGTLEPGGTGTEVCGSLRISLHRE